jgi:DNA polymerase
MDTNVLKTLEQLRSALNYHETIGIRAYRKSDDIDLFLDMSPQLFSINRGKEAKPSKAEDLGQHILEKVVSDDTIAELCDEIITCQSCELAKKRIVPVCGYGGKKVRLFVVGSWLVVDGVLPPSESVFGMAEDQMLEKMFKAINLSAAETYVANVIKCGIASIVQPQAIHIETCLSFLERQIAVTSPDIICTMGTVATRALLKVRQPLSQLRGTFHDYRIDENRTIPLMPTYHPSYLLKNPEMKIPTWSDLQRIEKALME